MAILFNLVKNSLCEKGWNCVGLSGGKRLSTSVPRKYSASKVQNTHFVVPVSYFC